ncbi:uncharacterized protein LOC110677943 isoform X2 [Aedes aegypti]|nr:uncharacterized protein LOC110677943 isoform X2 [Aedes aegypti]
MEFCRRRNCTIDLVVDSVNMWGVINPNRTGNGILGNVVERRADLGIGALSSWYHCYQYLAFSFAYERGGVTCVVPKPKQLPRWKEVAMGFTTSVYMTIFVTFCCTVVVYMLIVRLTIQEPLERTFAWNVLNVLAIYLLQATNIVRSRSVSETLLSVAVLIFSMNLATIYLGKYASLRTIPMYEPAIDTKEELAKSGITWMQAHEAWSYSLRLSDNPTEVSLCSNFKVDVPPMLAQIADQGNSAFALARLHNGHLMLGDWINAGNIHKYQLMQNDLYYEHEVAMATKTWPLMERFNELLGQASDASLLLLQEYQNIFQYNDYYVQMVALNSHVRQPNEPKPLAMEDVMGGFIILGSGLLCASVNFMIEVWILCPRKTKQVNDVE